MTHGVWQIVRFNWPFYVLSATALAVAVPAVETIPIAPELRGTLHAAIALAVVWTAGSLGASWLVYDHSPLMRWSWIPRALAFHPRSWINIHAGLDESTPALRDSLNTSGRVFDIYDPAEITEPSIARARRLARNAVPAERVDFRRLPAAAASVDAAFLLLSAHELRTHPARCSLFRELHRVLTDDGRVIVAEHLRDRVNFAAFGPGALHFHSRRTWVRCFRDTRFVVDAEFAMTPFVRVFVLRKTR